MVPGPHFSPRSVARRAIDEVKARGGAMAVPWTAATLGEPFLVLTLERQPSFWIAPVMLEDRVLGTIEIGLDGGVRGESFFYSSPDAIAQCPRVATRISAAEALELAAPLITNYQDAEISEPTYVHDTERGRLAWMIEIKRGSQLLSRVFATPGYAWEWRPTDPAAVPGVRG